MKVAFYGSSLLSAYWNGAATYYRGILKALAARGYSISFYEPDILDRQLHRDIDPPSWARSIVYEATPAGLSAVVAEARHADIVIKASGVGVFDDRLLHDILHHAAPGALRIFWDVDAPATLDEVEGDAAHPLRSALSALDLVLTYGGGPPIVARYRSLGVRDCVPVYNALDPDSHFPGQHRGSFACDLGFLANRLPDREARVREYFFVPAAMLPSRRFLLGGSGWNGCTMPPNVHACGHVGTVDHNDFNASALAVLNVARDSMARTGYSPATRVFEAAGSAACLITDAWEGIEMFLKPDDEVLVARDGKDVAEHLATLNRARAKRIGQAAQARVLAEHSYDMRAAALDRLLRQYAAMAREAV